MTFNSQQVSSLNGFTTPMSIQQTSSSLAFAIKILPTAIDQEGTRKKTTFHGRIRCSFQQQGPTVYICSPDLLLRVYWSDVIEYKLRSAWFQVFSPDQSLLQEDFKSSIGYTALAFNLFRRDKEHPSSGYKELYFIGQFDWESIGDSLVMNFQLVGGLTSWGLIPVTIRDHLHDMIPFRDASMVFAHSNYPKYEQQVDCQLWVHAIPWSYSTVYVQVFGWVLPSLDPTSIDEHSIECTMNGVSTTRVQLHTTTISTDFASLIYGFQITAKNPYTDLDLVFPPHSDFVLNCFGFKLGSKMDYEDSPAIGVQVQILRYNEHNIFDVDDLSSSNSYIHQTILNTPDPNDPLAVDKEFIDRYGFFELNKTNTPRYFLKPFAPLLWTGNTKQVLTNRQQCVSHYSLRFTVQFFDFLFEGDETQPSVDTIPIRVSLESSRGAKYLSGRWLIEYKDNNPESEEPDLVDAGSFILNKTVTSTNRLALLPVPLKGIKYQKDKKGDYEILVTLMVECLQIGNEPSSLLVVYEHDDVRSIDHHDTKYRTVQASAYSPYHLLFDEKGTSNTQMHFNANRVNLTSETDYRGDIQMFRYRYRFDIKIEKLPSKVDYWDEELATAHSYSELLSSSFHIINTTSINNTSINIDIADKIKIQPNLSKFHRLSPLDLKQLRDSNGILRTRRQQTFSNQQSKHTKNGEHIISLGEGETLTTFQLQLDPIGSTGGGGSAITNQPFEWVEFTFLATTFIFTGTFHDCEINGEKLSPLLAYNNRLYEIPEESEVDAIGFSFKFTHPDNTPKSRLGKYPTFHITCNDVYIVNYTRIEFDLTPHPERDWMDSTNSLSLLDPLPVGIQAWFSHYIAPSNVTNWFVLGTIAEFDVKRDDPYLHPALYSSAFMIIIGTALLGIWVYSGTEHAANNAIHRSARAKR